MVIRGNVGFNFGESGVGVKSTDKVATYNNTFYDLASAGGSGYGSAFVYYKSGSSSDYCSNGLVANSIISTTRDTNGSPIWFDPGATGIKTNNIGYATYFDSSFVSTNDPLFIDPTSPFRSFRVQPGSPAINSGTNVVWITSANSTGTTFNVNDGQLLIDGWGIVDGDAVTIGSTTTHVTSIVANSVTVASSVTWTNGQAVHWGSYITEDIGAFPYASSDLTWATILSNGSTYTVTPTGSARGVWFYVDGIPTNWVSSAPYSTTITNGTVTAKVYALYAQSVPVISASSPPQSQLGTFQFNGSATIIKGSFQ
jgi:hypothetical protein